MAGWTDLISDTPDWAIGCYLWPSSLLGDVFRKEGSPPGQVNLTAQDLRNIADTLTEIIHEYEFDGVEVKITRNGGMFMRPPDTFHPMEGATFIQAVDQRQAYERVISGIFDLFVVELNLRGYASEPTAPVHIVRANVKGNHVLATGGKSVHQERSFKISGDLLTNAWTSYRRIPNSIGDAAAQIPWATKLAAISETLPTIVSGAYHSYSRQQLPEALINSFVVVEQFVDHLWHQFADTLEDSSRRRNLMDTRTYTMAVRLEMLMAVGVIDAEFYSAANDARKHRNNAAHRAKISFDGATAGVTAMHSALSRLLGADVDHPQTSTAVDW